MGPEVADQLAPLASLFGRVCRARRPRRIALLGCATGNGLECVDVATAERVVGVDIHPGYLALARERHRRLGSRLDLVCDDVLAARLEPAAFDLVHAALIFEYLDPALLVARIAGWLAPGGACSVVLQLPAAVGSVTPTPYASVRGLAAAMRLVPPDELRELFREHQLDQVGYGLTDGGRNRRAPRELQPFDPEHQQLLGQEIQSAPQLDGVGHVERVR